jgi:hypothetical protein
VPILFDPIYGIIGLPLGCVMVDVLHTLYLGITAHIVANTIWYFAVIMGVYGGANQQERIQRCFNDMKAWYRRPRNQGISKLPGVLTVERVKATGGWPKLKAKRGCH